MQYHAWMLYGTTNHEAGLSMPGIGSCNQVGPESALKGMVLTQLLSAYS